MSDHSPSITLFDGKAEDWPKWRAQMDSYLLRKKMGPMIIGNQGRPRFLTANNAEAGPKPLQSAYTTTTLFNAAVTTWEATITNMPTVNEWNAKNNEFYGMITGFLGGPTLESVATQDKRSYDGCQAWKFLEDQFEGKGTIRLYSLLEEFYEGQIKRENETIKEYIIRMTHLLGIIRGIKPTWFDDEYQKILLIMGIRRQYPSYVQTLIARQDLNLATVISSLEELDSISKLSKPLESERDEIALAAYNKNKFDRFKPFRKEENKNPTIPNEKFKFRCSWCNVKGHKESECRGKKAGKPKYKERANLTSEVALSSGINLDSNYWILDSGATSHMTFKKEFFEKLEPVQGEINFAGDQIGRLQGVGNLSILVESNAKIQKLDLEKVLYSPDIRANLISVSKLIADNYHISFTPEKSIITKGNTSISLEKRNHLYTIKQSHEQAFLSSDLWHARLGHVNFKTLLHLQKKVLGMEIENPKNRHDDEGCEICFKAKLHRAPFKKHERESKGVGDLVHSDIAGHFPVHSKTGKELYVISFIDHYSRYIVVYPMKKKSEALSKFMKYCSKYGKPKRLRSDNGGEYISKKFEEFCDTNSIDREFTNIHTPEHNPIAERTWETLGEMTRALLIQKNLEKSWWARHSHGSLHS